GADAAGEGLIPLLRDLVDQVIVGVDLREIVAAAEDEGEVADIDLVLGVDADLAQRRVGIGIGAEGIEATGIPVVGIVRVERGDIIGFAVIVHGVAQEIDADQDRLVDAGIGR